MAYSNILRRLREEKTNYRKRGTLLIGRRDFITVNITNENTQVQILKPGMTGDNLTAAEDSSCLTKQGSTVSTKAVPAAYLTGYLAGKKALGNGAKDAVLYTGTRRYTQRMAAALKGVVDAGLKVPADPETFPSEDRIKGEHLTVKNDTSKVKSAIDSEVK